MKKVGNYELNRDSSGYYWFDCVVFINENSTGILSSKLYDMGWRKKEG